MPKKRQIPFLFSQALSDGSVMWHWKPSPRLRSAGFVNMKLGTDRRAAITAAEDQNDAVRAWEGGAAPGEAAPAPRPVPRLVRFDELVRRYRASPDFTGLRKSTRDEYSVRLRQLEHWALDGALHVRDIDKPLIRDLRNGLLETVSIYKTAGTLRVLRLLLQWAVDNAIVAVNPATNIDIPEPPSRQTRMDEPARVAIVEAAIGLGMSDVALAIELAFWTLQRQGDLLTLGRMGWRELRDLPLPRYVRQLADARGRVMGFRLQQQKTGAWIDAPIPPMLHDRIDAAFRDSNSAYVFAHVDHADRPMPNWMFQRRFRLAQWVAASMAIIAGDMALAEAIDVCQFRDLRRTGMIFYRSMGAKVPAITALSGHYVLGKKTIMDTYMPGDTSAAIECVAIGLEGWHAQQQEREAI